MKTKKNKILRHAYKLNTGVRDADSKIYINADLTPKERIKHRALLKEMKEKRAETNDRSWVIRGWEVVRKKAAPGAATAGDDE